MMTQTLKAQTHPLTALKAAVLVEVLVHSFLLLDGAQGNASKLI